MKTNAIIIILIILLSYMLMSLVHASTYDRQTNNCTHMSERWEDILERVGFNVTICVGYLHDNWTNGHMWIRVYGVSIDSVSLLPIHLTHPEYKECYRQYNDFEDWRKIYEK